MWKYFEKSSGGIVYRKNWDKIEVLLLRWVNSKSQEEYVIPKWHIEEWEIASEAAIREINEETGLAVDDLKIIKFLTKLNYTFTAGYLDNSPIIDKDVYVFLVKYTGEPLPDINKEERFVWYKWATFDEIKDIDIKFNLYKILTQNKQYFI